MSFYQVCSKNQRIFYDASLFKVTRTLCPTYINLIIFVCAVVGEKGVKVCSDAKRQTEAYLCWLYGIE